MMDEQLRDNVEKLLRGRAEAPSQEFLARVERTLPAPRRRDRGNFIAFAIAASLAVVAVTWAMLQSPPGESTSPAADVFSLQEEPEVEFDDPLLSEKVPFFLGWFMQNGAAFVGVTGEHLQWRDPAMGVQRMTTAARIDEIIAGPIQKGHIVPEEGWSHVVDDLDYSPYGHRKVIFLVPPFEGGADPKEGTPWVKSLWYMPFSEKNRDALAVLATKASSSKAKAELKEVRALLEHGRPLGIKIHDLLPYLYAIQCLEASDAVRQKAQEIIDKIEWGGGHPQLKEELKKFVMSNDYPMLRAVNSRVKSGRDAIELAGKALRLAPRASINLLLSHLVDDTLRNERGNVVHRGQNALTLLIEITDRGIEPWHLPADTEEKKRHNATLRADWKEWWSEMRRDLVAAWCFGLKPEEKDRLKMSWLPDPAPNGVESLTNRNDFALKPEDLEYAKKLGRRAVPFLLHSLRIDPPRATIWEEGQVEWNPWALQLLEAAAGVAFGPLDGRNNDEVLRKWTEWAHSEGLVERIEQAISPQVVDEAVEKK